jgi:REP-associated tyrosine transposase
MGLFPLSGIQLMELQRNTHHVYRLMYHFVWIPKYRRKVFKEPYRDRLKGIIEKIGYDYNIDIVELEIPEDHIHMVVRGEPKLAPSDVMQVVKSISAREFFRIYPEIRQRYFWGGKLWTQSYFVETIGIVNEEVIRAYVRDQLTEHEKRETRSNQLDLF